MDWMIEVGAGIIGAILGAIAGAIATHLLSNKKENKNSIEFFGARKIIDSAIPLHNRVKTGLGIKEIRVLNYAGTTIVDPNNSDYTNFSEKDELSTALFRVLDRENVKFTIILTNPESEAAREAIRSRKVINNKYNDTNREMIFADACDALKKALSDGGDLHNAYKGNRINCRLTDIALPYGLFQVIYNDASKNHIKVDLYSPEIPDEGERRTFYIYESKNKEDYNFFDTNIKNILHSATDFIEAASPTRLPKETK